VVSAGCLWSEKDGATLTGWGGEAPAVCCCIGVKLYSLKRQPRSSFATHVSSFMDKVRGGVPRSARLKSRCRIPLTDAPEYQRRRRRRVNDHTIQSRLECTTAAKFRCCCHPGSWIRARPRLADGESCLILPPEELAGARARPVPSPMTAWRDILGRCTPPH
jgi:hypothetical protein